MVSLTRLLCVILYCFTFLTLSSGSAQFSPGFSSALYPPLLRKDCWLILHPQLQRHCYHLVSHHHNSIHLIASLMIRLHYELVQDESYLDPI